MWVGGSLWRFDSRVSLLFGVINGYLEQWVFLFNRLCSLLSSFVCCVSGLQLPIDCNMVLLDKERRRTAL